METATLAAGCFWCTEAIFQKLKGVISITSGYSGGKTENPTYEKVSTGTTGHAESIQIQFDPNLISYDKLLEIFFHIHDPTTLNQQGADHGTQYRSAIFCHSDEQEKTAKKVREKFTAEKIYPNPITTEITKYTGFYPAEDYHKNFFNKNPGSSYCKIVINPKIKKLLKEFSREVKS